MSGVRALFLALMLSPDFRPPNPTLPSHLSVSATFNLLGFATRKQSTPDYSEAEEYYHEAIDLWPSNCGALAYLTEL